MKPYRVRLEDITATVCATAGDHIAKHLRKGRFYEEEMLAALVPHLVEREGIVVDVGAHVGNHTAFFANFRYVVAIEASPANFALLRKTVESSAYYCVQHPKETHCCPVAERSGIAVKLRHYGNNTGRTQMVPALPGESATLMTKTIDELVDGRPVCLIKMDIEGSEPRALAGATQTLDANEGIVLAIEARDADAKALVETQINANGRLFEQLGRYGRTATYIYRRIR